MILKTTAGKENALTLLVFDAKQTRMVQSPKPRSVSYIIREDFVKIYVLFYKYA